MLIYGVLLLFMTALWRAAEVKTALPYRPENGKCNPSEHYIKNLGICCSKCKPGTRLDVKCTIDSDSVCAPCPAGLYSDTMNYYENCHKCAICKDGNGLMYGTNCSSDTQSICVCKPGMFCLKQYSHSEGCLECKKYKTCQPGEGASRSGSPTSDVKCEACPAGMFSDRSDSEPCKPHTTCEGSSVLRLGNSTADTLCEMTPTPINLAGPTSPRWFSTTLHPTSTVSNTASVSTVSGIDPVPRTAIICTVGLLVLLILVVVVITCKLWSSRGLQKVPIPSTDGNKGEKDPSVNGAPDCQRLLAVDQNQKEPSMSSSDSQSQPDSSPSHSSGDWLERSSQEECVPEQPSISSPAVNLSLNLTATFNCQLSPSTACCSIPINPCSLTPHVEPPVPLSQEEVCTSSQQEDGKEALRSVQESGLCIY